jgi:hypothetical protein
VTTWRATNDLSSRTGRAVDPREVAKAFGIILRVARDTAGITHEVLAEQAYCDRTQSLPVRMRTTTADYREVD